MHIHCNGKAAPAAAAVIQAAVAVIIRTYIIKIMTMTGARTI